VTGKTFFCLLLLVPAISLFAAETAVTVSDADLDIPLEGAKILSWDGAEYVCGADGSAIITVPGDRAVVLRISYPGYENARLPYRPGKRPPK